ncbi:MAG: RecQ family ATP-dependent DNA helicase [Acidobacteria bacterium]|nr:RecQ family ATP-dependent DNA helicase [Acidobacteriota bacterium]
MTTSSTPTLGADHLDGLLRDALHRVWGFSEFRPLQREAMRAILASRDSVVVLPTGGGKSLCFQAPAIVDAGSERTRPTTDTESAGSGRTRPTNPDSDVGRVLLDPPDRRLDPPDRRLDPPDRRGLALVVSPLISLMKDQVDGLRVDGVAAAYLNSTLLPHERDDVIASVRDDRCRLLYVSPERIVGEGSQSLRRLLQQTRVRFIAIDEAHCISQWGHDFRPEYRQLGRLREEFTGVSVHAFTATATERVRRDIVGELQLQDPLVLVGSFDRPNLTYRVIRRGHLHRQLQDILARHENEAGIVYCSSRREVEALAEWLQTAGHRAVPYHAGLPDEVRSRHQEMFLDEHADIVVATVAFGMGIDRSNVRFVVHAGAPRSPEHYQQESGRAGRDGLPAECILIYSGGDFARWRQMLEANGEWSESARTLLRDMERYAAGMRCRHRALVEYFGESYDRAECGACDWCLKELDPVADSVTLARKILSCVARVKQTWGTAHVTDVLVGRATEKVVAAGHQDLSTFGLLKEESTAAIRGYIEQLVGDGLMARDGEPYPVLRLTASGATLLRGDGDCRLYREVKPPASRKRSRSTLRDTFTVTADSDLFDVLRDVRLRLARARGVPPYVIFHDTTLRDMVERRPKTIDDLHRVYGVGAKKAADFGDAFLDAIRTYRRPD